MKIINKLDDPLLELFPQYKKSNNNLGSLKEIVIDIAMEYEQSYNTSKNDFRINGESGRLLSFYRGLSNYYASWLFRVPEMVNQLGLSYKNGI